MFGEPPAFIDPKLMFGLLPLELTGPPFGVEPVAPDALMTTEGFFACSEYNGVVPLGRPLELATAEPPCCI